MASATNNYTAFVLHKRPFRETSFLVDFFTRDQGRITAVYRGARTASRTRTKAELFNFYDVALTGRGELKTVSSLELQPNYQLFSFRGVRLYSALYVNELLYKLLAEHDPCEDIFQAYEDILMALSSAEKFELHLRNFEHKLLTSLGYGLVFDCEFEKQCPIEPAAQYEFIPGAGFVQAAQTSIRGTAFVIHGEWLLAIAAGRWRAPEVQRVLKYVSQQAIAYLLKGKPLHSRGYFKQAHSNSAEIS